MVPLAARHLLLERPLIPSWIWCQFINCWGGERLGRSWVQGTASCQILFLWISNPYSDHNTDATSGKSYCRGNLKIIAMAPWKSMTTTWPDTRCHAFRAVDTLHCSGQSGVCLAWTGSPFKPAVFSFLHPVVLKLIVKPSSSIILAWPCVKLVETGGHHSPNVNVVGASLWKLMAAVAFQYVRVPLGFRPNGSACPHSPAEYEHLGFSHSKVVLWYHLVRPIVHSNDCAHPRPPTKYELRYSRSSVINRVRISVTR